MEKMVKAKNITSAEWQKIFAKKREEENNRAREILKILTDDGCTVEAAQKAIGRVVEWIDKHTGWMKLETVMKQDDPDFYAEPAEWGAAGEAGDVQEETEQPEETGTAKKIGMFRDGNDVVIFQIGDDERSVRANIDALLTFLKDIIRSESEQSPDRISGTVYDLTDEARRTHTCASPLSSESCKPSDSE